MSAWTYRHSDGKAAPKIVPPRPRIPCWKGLSADSEEKHEPVSDIDTVAVDSLKVLDPERPIREADMQQFVPTIFINIGLPMCANAPSYGTFL
jgi:hypothetical protein